MSEITNDLDPVRGWIEINLFQDAWDELERLPPLRRTETDAVQLRIKILQGLGKWEKARGLAESMLRQFPNEPLWWIDWTTCLRNMKILEARQILREALDLPFTCPVGLYALAATSCVLGETDTARAYLEACFDLEPMMREIALDDADFASIW